jgi:hypothetical protein
MGNTVSAAEITAAQILGSTEVEADLTPISRRLHGSPPPECPMHRKEVEVIIIGYYTQGYRLMLNCFVCNLLDIKVH